MAVTYDKIAFSEVEEGLKKIIDNEFKNVYISNEYQEVGNEGIRINLINSNTVLYTDSFEHREYNVNIRYYHKGDTANQRDNESIKGKTDRLRKHLLDNRTSSTYKWLSLSIEDIIYNVEDDENEDKDDLNITEFDVVINHWNAYT